MKILNYFETENKTYWLNEIKKCDWEEGKYLYNPLEKDELKIIFGDDVKVFLLIDNDNLISFCVYAKQPGKRNLKFLPWIGFLYTFPKFRGKKRAGKLLEYIYSFAKSENEEHTYITTDFKGLYEKYGYTLFETKKDNDGKTSFVYRNDIINKDYSDILGIIVSGTIDRPLGSSHPGRPEHIYPINYGYVNGIFSNDGEEQDVYVLGEDKPIKEFTGKVIGVLHRLNDVEDKWIVSLNNKRFSKEEIIEAINFTEQYFMSELYLLEE